MHFAEKDFKNPVFGVSVHAFGRIGCEKIFPNFKILCLLYTGEIESIRKSGVEVFCLEEILGKKPRGKRNPGTLLKNKKAREFIKRNSPSAPPVLILYKSSPYIDRLCRQNGWIAAANPAGLFKRFNNKVFFKRVFEKLGIPTIPGRIVSFKNLQSSSLFKEFPGGFVVQKPVSGGGGGTFFIKSKSDFKKTLDTLKSDSEVLPGTRLNVTRFIEGYSPSVTACTTKHGVLVLSPQLQLIDIPEVHSQAKGNGVFCGHDWSAAKKIPTEHAEEMINYAKKVGRYLTTEGYRGVFGLDFLIDKKSGEVFPVEINPRLLGVYPTSTMVQQEVKEPPLLMFHVLEFVGTSYKPDIIRLNNLFKKPKSGAHIFLYAPFKPCKLSPLNSGVYKIVKKDLVFVRPGFSLEHLLSAEEFLVVDGTVNKQRIMRKAGPLRMLRIVTKSGISAKNGRALNFLGQTVVRAVYKSLSPQPVNKTT